MTLFCNNAWGNHDVNVNGKWCLCWANKSHLLDIPDNASQKQILNNQSNLPIRQSLLKGIFPPQCSYCELAEKVNLRSARTISNESLQESHIQSVINSTDANGFVDLDRSMNLTIRLSDKCNMACRMCGPWASSLWNKNKISKSLNWDQFQQLSFDKISFAGGEPLLQPGHMDFLQDLIRQNKAQNIELVYNTNASIFNDSWIPIWKEFKHVVIGLSIDGVDNLAEYIRWPIKWKKINYNVDKFLSSSLKNLDVCLNPTVSVYNAYSIPELFAWSLKKGICNVSNNMVTTTNNWLSTQIFSHDQKKQLKDLYFNSKEYDCFKLNFEYYINWMMASDQNHLWDIFLQRTKKLDDERNQNFFLIQNSIKA